ncbi:MAG TPA: hypothetical protein VNN22_16490 [Verrucomicrobiae bacterium]|nr:hypothetical protein [Verrucomicrobiae bacterium]
MKKNSRISGLLQSGLILSAVSFLSGLGNFAFQAIISHKLKESGEYGLVNTTLGFVGLLGLPLAVATTAITHYIARFNFSGDDAQLRGLLAGCRKFLFRLTIAGSVLAVFLAKPLSDFFHFRTNLALAALVCVLVGLWGGFATALCQGLGWFKRLALIGFLGVGLRLLFGWLIVLKYPFAEWAVLASGIAVLANLVLLYWRKDLTRPASPVSPWNRELFQFFIVAAACVGGGFFFLQGDLLVAQRCFSQHRFSQAELDAYSSAGVFARALPMTVAPLLIVLFTHRSAAHTGDALREQLKLIALYAGSLLCGAIGLLFLRTFCLTLIGRNTPEAAAMIGPLALTMVFVALLQALAMWAQASRWIKIALLYGGLGLGYWLALFCFGNSPANLLKTMPIVVGLSFGILFFAWFIAMKRHRLNVPD